MVYQLGADEAGRGPVMGPMVLCALLGDTEKLVSIGVRDSKQLSEERRNAIFRSLGSISSWRISVVWPEEIDMAVAHSSLNRLELLHFASLIRHFDSEVAFVDAPDVDCKRFSAEMCRITGRKVVAEHRADIRYPAVSAASIVAKVTRDRIISEIAEELGEDIGSGYPGDSATIDFISSYVRKNGVLPPYCRRSWETSKRIISFIRIKNLNEFG
ncbi:MAG: ribonuclease HII [Candidatus Thermoplasmatota archaeon]|nr:ribonuclease HII [Candidatus Thermoplasmatota archaeon]